LPLSPAEPFVIPLLALLVTRLLFAYFIPVAAEDAYITFRYARAFAHGLGLVFNPGERVMGFTSPLWTLWLSLGFLVHLDPMVWARVSATAADVVTLILVTGMLRRGVSRASAWCFAVFFAVWPYFSAITASGMENNVMLMLMALSARLAERRHALTPVALAALAFSRPEGIAAAAVLALGARRRHAMIALGLAAAAYLPLALYYGSPIPQSVLAKAQIYGTHGPWAGRVWWMWLIPRPYSPDIRVVEESHLVTLAVFFTPGVLLGARRLWAMRDGPIAHLGLAGVVVWLGYVMLGVAYFYWYLLVPLACLGLISAVGLPGLIRGWPLYLSLGAYMVGVFADGLPIYFRRANIEFTGFVGAADYLMKHSRPGEKAFLEPIGMIGYACPLVIIDEVGLVSPEVARRRLQGPGWYTDVVAREQPSWLVVRGSMLSSGEAWAGVGAPFREARERDELLERYAIVDSVEARRADMALLILHRR
jgi:hypothetical protein